MRIVMPNKRKGKARATKSKAPQQKARTKSKPKRSKRKQMAKETEAERRKREREEEERGSKKKSSRSQQGTQTSGPGYGPSGEDLMAAPTEPTPAPNPPSRPGGDQTGGELGEREVERQGGIRSAPGAPDAGTGTPEDEESERIYGTREQRSDADDQRATNPGPTEKR